MLTQLDDPAPVGFWGGSLTWWVGGVCSCFTGPEDRTASSVPYVWGDRDRPWAPNTPPWRVVAPPPSPCLAASCSCLGSLRAYVHLQPHLGRGPSPLGHLRGPSGYTGRATDIQRPDDELYIYTDKSPTTLEGEQVIASTSTTVACSRCAAVCPTAKPGRYVPLTVQPRRRGHFISSAAWQRACGVATIASGARPTCHNREVRPG